MARVDTELLGLQIVALDDASVIGEVDGLIIDDKTMKVAGFLVDLGLFEASVLPFGNALAVGADAIVVAGADALAPITDDPDLDALATRDIAISDARVITRSGKTVGSIGDFFVDTDTGDVVGMEFIADDQSIYPKDTAVLPSAAVLRLGRDIIVVSDDYLQKLQRDAGSLDRLGRDIPAPIATLPEPEATPDSMTAPEPEVVPEPGPEAAPDAPSEPAEHEGALSSESASELGSSREADDPPTAEPDESAIVAGPAPAVEIWASPAVEEVIPEVTEIAQVPPMPEGDLEPQPQHFLIGKRVLRRIEGVEGEVVAEVGDIVTYEMIQRARSSDQLLILSLNVE